MADDAELIFCTAIITQIITPLRIKATVIGGTYLRWGGHDQREAAEPATKTRQKNQVK